MNKESYSIEKQRLSSSQYYYFQDDAIIKFQDFYKATNQASLNCKKHQPKTINDIFIGIRLNPKFQLGIYQIQGNVYVMKNSILSQNTGTGFLQFIFSKVQNAQDQKIDIAKLFFQAFEKQALNKPDLSVRDIYGPDSSTIGIPGYILASSLGVIAKQGTQGYQKNEIIRSIIISLSLSISQITALNTLKHNITTIIMLQDNLGSIIFTQYIYTLLKFYNPKAKILFKNQNHANK